MMNPWLGRLQKITFHRQLWKMLTTGAGEKKRYWRYQHKFQEV